MSTTLYVFLFALLFVAFFVAGMSITIWVKGRFIDSEIATNKHMQERGIHCAVEEARRNEQNAPCNEGACTGGDCASCSGTIPKRQ